MRKNDKKRQGFGLKAFQEYVCPYSDIFLRDFTPSSKRQVFVFFFDQSQQQFVSPWQELSTERLHFSQPSSSKPILNLYSETISINDKEFIDTELRVHRNVEIGIKFRFEAMSRTASAIFPTARIGLLTIEIYN